MAADRPDPFGSRPSARRRRPVLIGVGAVLLVGGLVAGIVGLFDVIGTGSDISDKAVARGRLGDEPHPITFSAEGGKDYSIYLAFGGFVSDETEQDATVGDTVCLVRHPDGQTSEIRGDRQGTSVSIGNDATIGWFTAQNQEGVTAVTCAYERGSSSSRGNRADGVDILITPGSPNGAMGGFLLIFGGVLAAALGMSILVRGVRGRRVPAS